MKRSGISGRGIAIIAFLIFIVSGLGTSGFGSEVKIVKGRLYVNGIPYTIKGIDYNPAPMVDNPEAALAGHQSNNKSFFDLLRQVGANTVLISVRNKEIDQSDFLNLAFNNGENPIYVILTFPIDPGRYPDITSPNAREKIRADFRETVDQYKDQPAVLMWTIGAEPGNPPWTGGTPEDLFSLMNEMAQEAHHQEGKDFHPVTATPSGVDVIKTIAAFETSTPDLDLWGIHLSRETALNQLLSDFRNTSAKPLLVMDFELTDNESGQEFKPPYRATHAEAVWNELLLNSDICLGGVLKHQSDSDYLEQKNIYSKLKSLWSPKETEQQSETGIEISIVEDRKDSSSPSSNSSKKSGEEDPNLPEPLVKAEEDGSFTNPSGPGWFSVRGRMISPEAAAAYYQNKKNENAARQKKTGPLAAGASLMAADSQTPEIQALARGLRHDPKLIYDYVHNHIDYVPYFGSLKGANLTYLDGSGNDFDQSSLMIALLRASGYDAQYVYGKMTVPGSQLANWLGVKQMKEIIGAVLASGGIPVATPQTDGTATVNRVWVKASIDGGDYLFDPAFKSYNYANKIDLVQAMGYNQSELLASASAGATITSDYVQQVNEANLKNKLAAYASNLITMIRNQYPNHELNQIISGRSIIQTNLTNYQTSLPFPPSIIATWDDIPAEYTATLRIQHVGIDYSINTPDLSGKRLTLTYASGKPELRLDGIVVASGNATTTGSKNSMTIMLDHPYASSGYCDQSVPYTPESGRTYAIVYNFGGVSNSLLQKRQQQIDSYRAQGLADTSESVLGETLNVMGHTWLKEVVMSNQLLSAMSDTVFVMHHIVGLMAQEAGYYIDVKAAISSINSKQDLANDWQTPFKVTALMGSAFEHGVLEQLMGSNKPGVSTMKLFQIANAGGRKVFFANNSNYATVKPQLINYSASDLNNFQNLVNNGRTLILPDNGQLILNRWKGEGYIAKYFSTYTASMGMIIGGGYFGGYAATTGYTSPPVVSQTTSTNVTSTPIPVTAAQIVSPVAPSTSLEPVDMAGGAYLYDRTDLALGGSAPLGLAFSRSYMSNLSFTKRSLGYGWTHNYDIYLSVSGHGDPGLGARQAVEAAGMVAALYVCLDLLKTQDNIVAWMTAALTSKWAVDQVIDNALTVNLGNKVMEYIKLPDGSYSAPPGITTQLNKNADGTYSLVERFGARINFNASKKVAKIVDVDGNAMTFTYIGTDLTSVKDAFNRTLTLLCSGGRIVRVTDSTGRYVSYAFDTAGNLASMTDPELKVWKYGYDTAHRMTSLTDPLNITTAANTYDGLGRVMTQTAPRQGGSMATYNFYFSGFRNAEEDPDGNTLTYYYDEKGREFTREDQLGNRSVFEFDNQNHIVKAIDPRSHSTAYLYDNQQNLIQVTNALNESITNAYDPQFRLTDITDPLSHNTHFIYDAEHHLIQTLDAVGNQTGSTYYANGFKNTATDGRGIVTTLTYDSYGNPKTSKTAARPAITYAYDSIGRMTALTDQVAAVTSFAYDKRGLLLSRKDPLSRTASYAYDSAGRLSTKTDRLGVQIGYAYTPTGKLERIAYPNASTVNFTYNNLDNLIGMQDALGTTGYSYDRAGRLISMTNPQGFAIGYAYDEAGNLTELTYPGNRRVLYGYDELNRLKTVRIDWLGLTAAYAYDAAGRLISLRNFNGTETTYGYDDANRLTSLGNKKSDTSVIANYQFTLDGNGNRSQSVQNEPLPAVVESATTYYAYNAQKNRLLTAGADSFSYDNEGRLNAGYGSSYTYDNEHRLVGMGGAIQFQYDGSGNRLQATRNGTVTRYIYDAAGNLLAEADQNNAITRYYIHGKGLLAMATPSNQLYCYHYNAGGSTMAMTNASQTMVNRYAYDPFGNIVNRQETVSQPFTFVGRFGVMTEPNGFYYMRARYYDPKVGRFISEDPIGFDGGDVNLYAYVLNNPVMGIDPSGLFWFRQDWQTDFVVGRARSLVEPGGRISRFIEDYVPAGRTFGDLHDAFVDAATTVGVPFALANIPSMVPMYAVALVTEVLRTLGIIDQPTPPAQPTLTIQPTTTRQTPLCK